MPEPFSGRAPGAGRPAADRVPGGGGAGRALPFRSEPSPSSSQNPPSHPTKRPMACQAWSSAWSAGDAWLDGNDGEAASAGGATTRAAPSSRVNAMGRREARIRDSFAGGDPVAAGIGRAGAFES